MSLAYFLALQVFCGCFAAYVAARQGRSRAVWFVVGTALPILGVLLALAVSREPLARARRASAGFGARAGADQPPRRRRPRRCCGSYIADCQGCPYFRRRPLFDASVEHSCKGHCGYFRKPLEEENGSRPERVGAEGE